MQPQYRVSLVAAWLDMGPGGITACLRKGTRPWEAHEGAGGAGPRVELLHRFALNRCSRLFSVSSDTARPAGGPGSWGAAWAPPLAAVPRVSYLPGRAPASCRGARGARVRVGVAPVPTCDALGRAPG